MIGMVVWCLPVVSGVPLVVWKLCTTLNRFEPTGILSASFEFTDRFCASDPTEMNLGHGQPNAPRFPKPITAHSGLYKGGLSHLE
jgi:hypothetical protein